MSNEMKDQLRDKKVEAEWWIERYPFLRIENVDDEHQLEGLPQGWIDAFGKQMCDDLMEALGEYATEWEIVQVKEKFGAMRLYHNGCPKEIYNKVERIIEKYAYISQFVCVHCGSLDAQLYDDGWITPWCNKCFAKMMEDRGMKGTDWSKYIAEDKFSPTYEIRRYSEDGITTEIVDVSNEWGRLKN